jgi:DNA-binding CsgD family transcriptional regulator
MPILREVEERMIRIEAKLDALLAMQGGSPAPVMDFASILSKFTTKQHVAIQCILCGFGNDVIAKRMGVELNTAKVHVRGVAKKLGVHRRSEIVFKLQRAFELISDDDYLALSGGLPKRWAIEYTEPCPYYDIYANVGDVRSKGVA